MRNRKFACGMLALCLALSVAGCGKSSEEKQAANYYQKELGLDKDEAEELAHELYGRDEDDGKEEPSVTDEVQEEIVVEPLPELVNSEWYDRKVQLYDMVFTLDEYLTEEVIRKTVEGSAYDVELVEDFDKNGNVCLNSIMLDGEYIALFQKQNRPGGYVSVGLFEAGDYYNFNVCVSAENNFYDKEIMEVEALDFKMRENVLAYLAENGFVEVEEKQAPYINMNYIASDRYVSPDGQGAEFVDVPHYYCKGAQRISFFRIHKLNEIDQEIEYQFKNYSGCHLNLFEHVSIEFNTDGTISSIVSSTSTCLILEEKK